MLSYMYTYAALTRVAAQQQDVATAYRYNTLVVDKADRHMPCYAEEPADLPLKAHDNPLPFY